MTKKEAKEYLVQIGYLIPAEQQPLYHGRAGYENDNWEVDPHFDNSGNNTGNANIGKVPALYTADDYNLAREFALERTYEGQEPQVHQVTPRRKGYYILNCYFEEHKVPKDKIQKFVECKKVLLKDPATKYAPVSFEEREIADVIQANLDLWTQEEGYWPCDLVDRRINNFVESQDFLNLWNKKFSSGKEGFRKFVEKLVKVHSTKLAMRYFGWKYFIQEYIGGKDYIYGTDYKKLAYFDPEYVRNWAIQNGIIGAKHWVDSATVGKEIDSYTIFGIEKIKTKKARDEASERDKMIYSSLGFEVSGLLKDPNMKEFFENATPEEMMRYAYENPALKELYSKDAGNWEKWSVASHTVATIDFYQKNYQMILPIEFQPLMNVALLAHDIGKGCRREYGGQKQANLEKAKILYDIIGVEPQFRGLLNFIIGDSQEYTGRYYFDRSYYRNHTKKEIAAEKKKIWADFTNRCRQELSKTLKREATDAEVLAFRMVCDILQHCDSGAYTRYAKVKTGSIYSYAGNDNFTASFKRNKNGVLVLRNYEDDLASMI